MKFEQGQHDWKPVTETYVDWESLAEQMWDGQEGICKSTPAVSPEPDSDLDFHHLHLCHG
jgi:hypothetical protein